MIDIENLTIFNIREYSRNSGIGEADLNQLISDLY